MIRNHSQPYPGNGQLSSGDEAPEEWREWALCTETDPEIFFSAAYDPNIRRAARKICASCPVQPECLEYALTTKLSDGLDAEKGKENPWGRVSGIWGGTTAKDRLKIRKARGLAA